MRVIVRHHGVRNGKPAIAALAGAHGIHDLND
jgi:hypothetical protein